MKVMSTYMTKESRSRPCTWATLHSSLFHCSCVPYNGVQPPHKLSTYGSFVSSFCHAKLGVEEKRHSSITDNPVFVFCCHSGMVLSIWLLGFKTPILWGYHVYMHPTCIPMIKCADLPFDLKYLTWAESGGTGLWQWPLLLVRGSIDSMVVWSRLYHFLIMYWGCWCSLCSWIPTDSDTK